MEQRESRGDLETNELTEIARRVNSALQRQSALSYYALQATVCERYNKTLLVDPRMLVRALGELANNRRPRKGAVPVQGPWSPFPRIYVSPNLTRANAEQHAGPVAGTQVDRLRASAEWFLSTDVLGLAEAVAKGLNSSQSRAEQVEFGFTHVGGDVQYESATATVIIAHKNLPPSAAWVSNELEGC